MNNIANDDLGIKDVIYVLCRGASFVNGNSAIEGKLGVSASISAKGGAVVGGRIEAAAEIGIMENSLIMDKGNLIIPESDDPMKGNIESVNAALNSTLNSISEGLRDTLIKIKSITS